MKKFSMMLALLLAAACGNGSGESQTISPGG